MATKLSRLPLSREDFDWLERFIFLGELKLLKSFLSAKNIALSETVLWSEDERNVGRRYGTPIFDSPDTSFASSLLYVEILAHATSKKRLTLVKHLLKAGASPNVGDSTGDTPLHALFRHPGNDIKAILCCLVKSGADVNATNELGVTPLMVAAKYACVSQRVDERNFFASFRYLLKKGANPNVVDVRGFSVVHYVALRSKKYQSPKFILQELLLAGADPMFKSAPFSNEERQQYVPCPLYLAASWGREEIVTELLTHPQCSPVCKAEAHLLLAATDCDENGMSLHTQELWSKALCIYEENDIHPAYLPPIEAYGSRVEIQSIDQLQELSSSSTSLHEAYYQSLIIRERCIGTGCGCLSLINALKQRGEAFLKHQKNVEAEQLFLHAIEVLIHVLDHVEVYDEEVMKHRRELSDNFIIYFMCEWLDDLCSLGVEKFVPSFEHFAKYAIKLYNALSRYNISERAHAGLILQVVQIFAISCDASLKLESDRVCYTLEELGHEFVSKLLQEPTTLSVLHESVSLLLGERRIYSCTCTHTADPQFFIYFPTMLNVFLRWGADRIIDQPNSRGERFLHLAVLSDYATLFVPILLEHNPHLDAVDGNGKTAFDICKSDELRSLFPSDPLPLTCQAAKVVVSEGILYQELDLPAHIKTFISFHDFTYS